jgi:hypothetical protein
MNGRESRIEILSPKFPEPRLAQLRVARGVRDRDVAEPVLNRPPGASFRRRRALTCIKIVGQIGPLIWQWMI